MSYFLSVALTICVAASWPGLLVIPAGAPSRPIVERKDADLTSSGTDAVRTSVPRLSVAPAIRGRASWYSARGSVAAAGPALRKALGPGWRGTWVRVSAGSRSVLVRLDDWCQCYTGTRGERLVDLSDDDFAVLAPLASGVMRVRITAILPPATDTP